MNNYKIVLFPLVPNKNIWSWSIKKNDIEVACGKHIEGKNSKEECFKRAKEISKDLNLELYELTNNKLILIGK